MKLLEFVICFVLKTNSTSLFLFRNPFDKNDVWKDRIRRDERRKSKENCIAFYCVLIFCSV